MKTFTVTFIDAGNCEIESVPVICETVYDALELARDYAVNMMDSGDADDVAKITVEADK